jgi:hypothetical protein
MTDQSDRERESQQSEETKFEERVQGEEAERDRLAERMKDDPIVDEPEE